MGDTTLLQDPGLSACYRTKDEDKTHLGAEEEDEGGRIQGDTAGCGEGACFSDEQARDAPTECVFGCIVRLVSPRGRSFGRVGGTFEGTFDLEVLLAFRPVPLIRVSAAAPVGEAAGSGEGGRREDR